MTTFSLFLVKPLIRLWSLVVPVQERSAWREEWLGEFLAASTAPGSVHTLLRLVPGLLSDALAMRRYEGARPDKTFGMRLRKGEGAGMMDGWWRDTKQVMRGLVRQPAYMALASLTLALGVGVTTAMFGTVHSVVLSALPYGDMDRLYTLSEVEPNGGISTEGVSAANAFDVIDLSQSFTQAGFADGVHGLRMVRDGDAESLRAWVVSDGFFSALDASATLGRAFTESEYASGGGRVVMLSHSAWTTRFGADPNILGQELVLDDVAHVVVGVLQPDFRYPSNVEAWTPRAQTAADEALRGRPTMKAVVQLRPGVDQATAAAELTRLAGELEARYPLENEGLSFQLSPLREAVLGDVEKPLLVLFLSVILVLLVASANVAGLQLTRELGRGRQVAVRAALGANRGQLLRISAIESVVLATLGGAIGVGIAHLGITLIQALGPDHLPRIDGLGINTPVLAFALLATFGGSLTAGVLPALLSSRTPPARVLGNSSRGGSLGPMARRFHDGLVVAEIAVALALTVGAGLLVRSFTAATSVDLGFQPNGLVAAQVWAYDGSHGSDYEYFERGIEALRNLPSVQSAGLTSDLPLAADDLLLARTFSATVRGPGIVESSSNVASVSVMDHEVADALGIELIAGRTFRTTDDGSSTPVAVVNQSFVSRFFPNDDPIGQLIRVGFRDEGPRRIVGVLGDVRRRGGEASALPEVYLSHGQVPMNGLTFVVRSDLPNAALTSLVRETLKGVDPGQAIWANMPVTDLVTDRIRHRRFNTTMLTGFSALAVALAAIGLYGLIAYAVQQRVREFGIRRALGSTRTDLLLDVLRQGLRLAGIGAILGAVGATAVALGLRGMLFGVEPVDPITLAGVSALIFLVTAAAVFAAARGATGVTPLVALSGSE